MLVAPVHFYRRSSDWIVADAVSIIAPDPIQKVSGFSTEPIKKNPELSLSVIFAFSFFHQVSDQALLDLSWKIDEPNGTKIAHL